MPDAIFTRCVCCAPEKLGDAAGDIGRGVAGLSQKVWDEAGKALEHVNAVVLVPGTNFLSVVVDGIMDGVNKAVVFVIQLETDVAQFAALVVKKVCSSHTTPKLYNMLATSVNCAMTHACCQPQQAAT